MQQLLSSLEDERQRQFRRFLVVSALVHLGLGFLFWWSPLEPVGTALPAVVRVDLVTVADIGPAPKPAEAAAARPPPPPPPPPPEVKKVLPKQPAPLPKPKPVEAKPKPKPPEPKPQEKPREEPKPPEPALAPEQDYDDVLAQLRQEAGETAPRPVEQQAAAQPVGGPAGLGQLVSPEVAQWIRDVKMHVTRAWILEPGFRLQALETKLDVDVSPTGEVLGMRITKSSGNPWYDESVERAIRKASPLPAPPDAGEWPFSFKPSDL